MCNNYIFLKTIILIIFHFTLPLLHSSGVIRWSSYCQSPGCALSPRSQQQEEPSQLRTSFKVHITVCVCVCVTVFIVCTCAVSIWMHYVNMGSYYDICVICYMYINLLYNSSHPTHCLNIEYLNVDLILEFISFGLHTYTYKYIYVQCGCVHVCVCFLHTCSCTGIKILCE